MDKVQPKRFRSCFIREVALFPDEAVLEDTAGQQWRVDLADKNLAKQFAAWFKDFFMKRTAQELTVFQYETKPVSECELETRVVDFTSLRASRVLAG